ncbi:hypothetical protein [Frankia sp. CiP3]|uniref:hypothetical protein n=1 Tax=Frankia sp. CiP3 TaxID=2880971 RepID=UPI001EF40806|nr:hypothetical protein [Frankia sp. CiP3]
MSTGKDAAVAQAPRIAEPALGGTAAGAAEEFARRLGSKRREAGAPVRNYFVADDREGVKPPLAHLLSASSTGGGGRGGQLRLKIYLSLLWVCAAPPYAAIRPARAWAGLLGLDDPEGHGARRVQEAMRDLQNRRMVSIHDRGGHASAVTPLIELGTGKPYMSPSETYSRLNKMKGLSAEQLAEHRYFRVPSTLWTSGLISRLTGPGLAMLLVLRCEQQGKDGDPVWFSPERALTRFGLAESTRRQGLEQLRKEGIVTTVTRKLSESGDFIDVYRRRKVHTLVLSPGQPITPTAA